jgi:tetratricopeptide (TPR) repeat protein
MGRSVIQDFTPLAESLEWELGQLYFRERGNKAFIGDAVPTPFAINNNGFMSVHAAEIFFASLVEAERAGPLEPDLSVLELGPGIGLFARFFLDHLRDLCDREGKDYYDRLTYVAADRSERMLRDLCTHGIFANHPGRYRLRVVDALSPERDLAPDAQPVTTESTTEGTPVPLCTPFRAVFLNYLLDCLPATFLELDGQEGVRQLCVQTCLARDVRLEQYTDLQVEDLRRLAASEAREDRKVLLGLSELLRSESAYLPAAPDRVPYGSFAVHFARSRTGRVWHSHGAIQCLDHLLGLLHGQGFILVNDYGSARDDDAGEFDHHKFYKSTDVGINFALLKAYFAEANEVRWIEPAEDNGHIYSRLLGRAPGPETVLQFTQRFGKAAFERGEAPAQEARRYAEHGRYDAAAAAFRTALEREPYNWLLMREVSTFLAFALREPAVGLEMARRGLELNPTCSPSLWNALGDCLFSLDRLEEARAAFERALALSADDVEARYNLSCVQVRDQDYPAALRSIAEGLGLDRTGDHRERFLRKQAEVLDALSRRHRQEHLFLVNRLGTASLRVDRAAEKPDGGRGPAGEEGGDHAGERASEPVV